MAVGSRQSAYTLDLYSSVRRIFMTENGIHPRLKYSSGTYGAFANTLPQHRNRRTQPQPEPQQ